MAKRLPSLGLVVSTWGNVSALVEGTPLIAITPSGIEYDGLTEEMICVLDGDGRPLEAGGPRPSSELPMHLAIYRARPDAGGIVHTHSVHATAHAALRIPVPALVEDLAQMVGGAVECSEYAPAGSSALAEAVVRALAGRNAALIANHGVVGVGRTVHEALRVCLVTEQGARVHSIARTMGVPALVPEEDVRALHRGFDGSGAKRRRR